MTWATVEDVARAAALYALPRPTGLDDMRTGSHGGRIQTASRRATVACRPLHPRRLRQRGFNPAALLARCVAAEIQVPFVARGLRRMRDTPHQTGLGAEQRRRNVRAAFGAARALPPRIWLVDDVVTTGSTLKESARACRIAGAEHVTAICVASTRGSTG